MPLRRPGTDSMFITWLVKFSAAAPAEATTRPASSELKPRLSALTTLPRAVARSVSWKIGLRPKSSISGPTAKVAAHPETYRAR